ncbi:hypothetical protein [Georgenia sp. SUBG003]
MSEFFRKAVALTELFAQPGVSRDRVEASSTAAVSPTAWLMRE